MPLVTRREPGATEPRRAYPRSEDVEYAPRWPYSHEAPHSVTVHPREQGALLLQPCERAPWPGWGFPAGASRAGQLRSVYSDWATRARQRRSPPSSPCRYGRCEGLESAGAPVIDEIAPELTRNSSTADRPKPPPARRPPARRPPARRTRATRRLLTPSTSSRLPGRESSAKMRLNSDFWSWTAASTARYWGYNDRTVAPGSKTHCRVDPAF